MSYLDFLYKKIILKEDGLPLNEQIGSIGLLRIMEMCLGLDYRSWQWDYDKKGKMKIVANGIEINGKDFDDFRRIVMYQNFSDYDDEDGNVSEDIKLAIQEYNRIANNGLTPPSFEKQISCIQLMGFTKQQIKEMTYRSFKLMLDTDDDKLTYQIMKSAELNGTTFKDKVEHYLYRKKKDKYADYFASRENLENNMNGKI